MGLVTLSESRLAETCCISPSLLTQRGGAAASEARQRQGPNSQWLCLKNNMSSFPVGPCKKGVTQGEREAGKEGAGEGGAPL